MTTRITKELAYFLKERGIYTSFMKYNRKTNLGFVNLQSFDWFETSEGETFWKKVSDEYADYLTAKIFEYFKIRDIWKS